MDNFREWTVPKTLLPTPEPFVKPSKTPIHHFDSLIVTTGKTPTTSNPKPAPTASSLFCPVDELQAQGLRVSRCKFTGQFNYLKPAGSSSNQGLIKGKVLHGAQCRISCASYKKKPFRKSILKAQTILELCWNVCKMCISGRVPRWTNWRGVGAPLDSINLIDQFYDKPNQTWL